MECRFWCSPYVVNFPEESVCWSVLLFVSVTYTPGRLSSWGRDSPVNDSRYVESTSSSPRSDRRDMDSMDRRRYRGYALLFPPFKIFLFSFSFSFPALLFFGKCNKVLELNSITVLGLIFCNWGEKGKKWWSGHCNSHYSRLLLSQPAQGKPKIVWDNGSSRQPVESKWATSTKGKEFQFKIAGVLKKPGFEIVGRLLYSKFTWLSYRYWDWLWFRV